MSSVAILGGGIGGLATAYLLESAGYSYDLFERSSALGGLAQTFDYDGFKVDSGAHRIHDVDDKTTRWIRQVVGEKIHEVDCRSGIIKDDRMIDFPLTPINLLINSKPQKLYRYFQDWVSRPNLKNDNFHQNAVNRFGKSLAKDFILDYSSKLWGVSAEELSPELGMNRLKSMTLKQVFKELVFKESKKNKHLDGRFLYPQGGFGNISKSLEKCLSRENIHTCHRVDSIHRLNGGFAVHINGKARFYDKIISTLPLPLTAFISDWCDVNDFSDLRFRSVATLFVTLNKPSVSEHASLYISDPNIPITRIHEPRNRCQTMSPKGKTSLLAEMPLSRSLIKKMNYKERIKKIILCHLRDLKLVKQNEVINSYVNVMHSAYPVITLNSQHSRKKVLDSLMTAEGFYCLGRNATFRYLHVHDILKESIELVGNIDNSERCEVQNMCVGRLLIS